jgi:hypothetical protein
MASVSLVSIGRFSADVAARPAQVQRVDALARAVVEQELGRTLGSTDLPPGIWCVRRLDLHLDLDLAGDDGQLRRAWGSMVSAGLRAALQTASPDVVHYRHRADAAADLIGGAVSGRTDRAWAWMQAGASRAGDPDPRTAPAAAILATLRRMRAISPADALPVLMTAIDTVGLPALHRVLAVGPGSSGSDGAGADRAGADGTGAGDAGTDGATWAAISSVIAGAPDPSAAPSGSRPADTPGLTGSAQRLAGELVSRSRLARAVAASRLRPDPAVARAWALLVIAETDPFALGRPSARGLPAAVAALLSPGGPPPAQPAGTRTGPGEGPEGRPAAGPESGPPMDPEGPSAGARPAGPDDGPGDGAGGGEDQAPDDQVPGTGGQSAARDPAHDPLPTPGRGSGPAAANHSGGPGSHSSGPGSHSRSGDARSQPQHRPPVADAQRPTIEGPVSLRTSWAGLLFLLTVAPTARIPHRVLADQDLANRSLAWVLQGIAAGWLPIGEDDPALAAFAGLDPGEASPWFTSLAPPTRAERAALARIADRWAQALDDVVSAAGRHPGAASIPRIAARHGTVVFRRGWIEVQLPMDEVDVDVRVIGLDLDPGWVPWLGHVLQYRYV